MIFQRPARPVNRMASSTSCLRPLARAAAALAAGLLACLAAPATAQTLVIGDAASPASQLLCPGGAATTLDAFTMQATVTDDVVTRLTVQLAPAGAWVNVRLVEITNAAGTTVYGSAIPGGDQVNVYLAGLTQAVAAGATTYNVRITPQTHAAMPPPNIGQSVALTGTVVSAASNNPRTYADTTSATLTIDNLSPPEIRWSTVTTAATSVTMSWAAATNTLVLMRQGGPVTDSPAEGSTYAVNALVGASQAICVGVNATSCVAGGLVAGASYSYEVFTRDACTNYSMGSPLGPIFPGGLNEGNPAVNTLVPVVAILNPASPATVTTGGAGFRVQVRAYSRTNGATAQPVTAIRLKAAAGTNTFTTNCGSAVDYPIALSLNPNYPNAAAAGAAHHGVYEANVIVARGAYTLRACAANASGNVLSGPVGITVNDGTAGSPRGSGHLLVRDNGGQLCSDCHALASHSAETVGNGYGSWYADCRDCHAAHGTTNVELVRTQITPPAYQGPQPPRTVVFSNHTAGFNAAGGVNAVASATFANGDGTGVCQVCHTRTTYFRSDGTLTNHNPTQACTNCHAHDKGLKASCTSCHGARGAYTAIPGADSLASAAPPTAADGTNTLMRVGAHQAHVNGKGGAATYRTNPLACADCHPIPNVHNGTRDAAWSVLATNTIVNGVSLAVAPTPGAATNAYSATWEATATCTNACHGANIASNASKPAPAWTGGALTCTSCHGAPPPLTATANQTHPRNTACGSCHGAGFSATAVNKAVHIDGTLTRTTSGCTGCHGDLGLSGVTLTVNLPASAPGQTGSANSVDSTGATNTTAPGVGAHLHHLTTTIYRGPLACTECHALPASATDTTHATGTGTGGARATLTFGTLARGVNATFNNELVAPAYTGSTSAAYGATAGSCASTYCHGQFKNGAKATIGWTATGITCNGCHGRAAGATATPPGGNHPNNATCATCHSGYTGTTVNLATHVNGALDVLPMGCASCHGDAARTPVTSATWNDVNAQNLVKAAPPSDSTGATSGNQVGAHLAHVNQGAAAPPLSNALRCENCHTGLVWTTGPHGTPANPVVWGNLAIADGALPLGYSTAARTCSNTYCHGEFAYGKKGNVLAWGTGTPAKQACNSCHGQTVATPEPNYPHPQNTSCGSCHTGYTVTTVAPSTHVDGLATKSTSGCTACHGELGAPNVTTTATVAKAAPGGSGSGTNSYDTTGLASGNVIGAHKAHLVGVGVGGTPRWRSSPIACTECHALPPSNTDTTHATGTGTGGARATVAWGNLASDTAFETKVAAYTRYTCSNTYCHDPKSADTAAAPVAQVNAPAWNAATTVAQCGSCHGLPPVTASHPANALCGSCHPGYTATAPTAASAIAAVNALIHINGQLEGGESSGGTPCLNCHKTDGATGARYNMMVADTTVYHHVMSAETGTFQTYPTTSAGKACLNCHADHDVFNPTLNAANTIGRGANLRATITTAPTKVAPASGNYANTDFSGTAGLCLSCHASAMTKSTTAQLADGTIAAPAIGGAAFAASAHQYTVTGNISSGGSPVLVNCVKCHSDGPGTGYPQYQGGTFKFALHTSVDRRLLNPLGITAPADNLEEKFCYRCHAASTDATPGGGPAKTITSSDWFGAATAMPGGSTGIYAAMQKGTGAGVPTLATNTLYFRPAATSAVDGPKPGAYLLASGTYAGTTTFTELDLALAAGTTTATRTNTSGTTTATYLRFFQLVSPPVTAAVTIPSGATFTIKTRAQVSAAGDTENERFQIWRRTAAGVNTALNTATQENVTVIPATAANRTYAFVTNTAVTLAPGDGLILEIETRKSTATSSTVTESYGNFATDAASLVLPVAIIFQSGVAGTASGRHDVGAYAGLHRPNPAEEHLQRLAATKHVECADCHDPHEARRSSLDSGTASAASTSNTTLTDATHAWTASQWVGYSVLITATGTGTATGQVRGLISANTATQLTFAPGLMNYAATPAALSPPLGSAYRIHLDGRSGLSAAAAIGATALTPAPALTPGFPVNAYVGGLVRIVEGPGVGQVRTVTANTATALTVTPAWTTALTTASRWALLPPPTAMLGASGVDVPTWAATNWTASTFSPAAGSNTLLPAASADWQVCFKCHASANTALATWSTNWTDLALEFNPSNKSYHPVAGALPAAQPTVGSNQLAASQLINGWTPGSVMTCTDCHGADAASPAAQGPHGSAVKYMLTGINRAWPYTVAGASSGTLFYIPTADAGIGTANGLFCRNCHPVMTGTASNTFHRVSGIPSGQHSGSNAVTACTGCHIRVPHGGKVSRLIVTNLAPARYIVGTPNFARFIKAGFSGYTISNMGSTCSTHSSGGTGGEAW
jgi:predicted CxxxxCH...CXXCH cytochrome family protein